MKNHISVPLNPKRPTLRSVIFLDVSHFIFMTVLPEYMSVC